MDAWLEIIGVFGVILLGCALGTFAGRLRKPYWLIGYFAPLLLLVILVTTKFNTSLSFLRPFSWLVAGRTRFVTLALVVTVSLITLLPHIRHKYQRIFVSSLIVIFVSFFSLLPFIGPLLVEKELSNLETTVNSTGVCLQSNSYTCGPAAAVTALRKLGLPANEGEIAILSRTIPIIGTLPKSLQSAIQKRYGSEGLQSEYRSFESISQLKGIGVVLAVMKSSLMSDHCVAVLDVTDSVVKIADPVSGRLCMSYEQFAKMWRFSGIVLKRPIAEQG